MRRASHAFRIGAALSVVVVLASMAAAEEEQAEPSPSHSSSHAEDMQERLTTLVPKIRQEKKLIGLAAMIMVDGQVIAQAADGERKKKSGIAVETKDRWHLGSITKSITATMIARLVERNQIDWKTTVGDCFPAADQIHAEYQAVTLDQLLTHTAGTPANFPIKVQFQRPEEGEKRMRARRTAVLEVLRKKPKHPPGEKYSYSNVGFTVAGAMAEAKTGQPWEDLVRQEIFTPLNLRQAGFGSPKSEGDTLSQPRGHQKLGPFKRAVGETEDNTPIIGPAGTVHMALADLCIYGNEHLLGELGEGQLLTAASYQRLHSPQLQDYAYGWVVPEETDWVKGRLIWHNGSNTMWYAMLFLLPDQHTVIAIASNDGDIKRAESAAHDIARQFAVR